MFHGRKSLTAAAAVALLVVVLAACAGGGKVKLPVIKDTVAWMYRGEPTFDFGRVEPLFVEGAHYATLLGFDISAARGKKVTAARLWLHREGEAGLVSLVLSTIAADWVEGKGKGQGPDPGGSCAAYVRIDQASGKPIRWAGPGSDITDVIMTEGNTLRVECEVRQESGTWQSVDVPVPLVESILSGDSYGLALVDGKGQLRNPDDSFISKRFNSRDSKTHVPYLEVVLEDIPAGSPEPPRTAEMMALPYMAGIENGAVKVLVAPQGEGDLRGHHYEMVVSSLELTKDSLDFLQQLPRYLLPHISQAAQDTIFICDLAPSSPQYAAVRTVDRYGRKSGWVFTRGFASSSLALPGMAREKRPSLGGEIRVWPCGAGEKINPVNGRLLEENPGLYGLAGASDYDYMYASHLWEAAGSTVTLDVPRGGTAAFQLVIEPKRDSLGGIEIKAEWLNNPGIGQSKAWVRIYKVWYIKSPKDGAYYTEVAVPFDGPLSIPDPVNKVEGQRNQAVLVEFYIPRSSRPGSYRGRVQVGARGLLSRNIEVKIEVHKAMLPEELPFISELNVYSPVGDQYGLDNNSDDYFDLEQQYYRLAHEHLAVINQLPYSQTGTIKFVGAPALEGEGAGMRVSDWSRWDKRFGRYLDGSAFAGTDRRVPVPVMYLPFHENWPGNLKKYYRFTPHDTSYVGQINEHTLNAPPIGKAFDPAYEEAFLAVFRQFAGHFREKGWNRTEFQFYLNNKYYWKGRMLGGSGSGISWWLLDEPYHWDDFKALAYFGELFTRAVGGISDIDFIYRLDISRPQLAFGLFNGLKSVSYVSQYFYDKNAYLLRHKELYGADFRNYGSFNDLEESNLTTAVWPLKVVLNGGTGLLPWQTIGEDRNFESFQNTAVLYPGIRFGIRGPVTSLRLKAVRQGTEDAVLLMMLSGRKGWNLEQMTVAVAEFADLSGGGTISEFFDDAGRVAFPSLRPQELANLRRAVLLTLDE